MYRTHLLQNCLVDLAEILHRGGTELDVETSTRWAGLG